MHELAEVLTLLDAWTYLAIQETPESEPARHHLHNLRSTIARLIDRAPKRLPTSSARPSSVSIQNQEGGGIQESRDMCLACSQALERFTHRYRNQPRPDTTT